MMKVEVYKTTYLNYRRNQVDSQGPVVTRFRIPFKPAFFRLSFRYYSSNVYNWGDRHLNLIFSAIQIYISIHHIYILHRLNTNSYNDQLPDALMAQLVEHCTSIAKARVQILFRLSFCYLSSNVYNCDDLHLDNNLYSKTFATS